MSRFDPMAIAGGRGGAPWSVAALLSAVSDMLSARLGGVCVRGELGSFTRAASGHCYFTLKDASGAQATLRCAMFKRAASLVDFSPADGQQVELRGRLAVYEARGELQMVVESLQRVGVGSLYEEFLRLKAKLQAQGLFELANKRALPPFPRRVGVVTSPSGAALHDVLITLGRRAPHVRVVVYPSLVQGTEAPSQLVRALQTADARAEVDLLILCRGGGSLEDLWAFNDESLVRAIAAMHLPVICGVGHETDLSLADLAADVRAATPTAAAELAVPERSALMGDLLARSRQIGRQLERQLDQAAQRLDTLGLRLQAPAQRLQWQRSQLQALASRGHLAVGGQLRQAQGHLPQRAQAMGRAAALALQIERSRLHSLQGRLQSLNPHQVLARGFVWVEGADGRARTSVAGLKVGEQLEAVWSDGRADLKVTRLKPPST